MKIAVYPGSFDPVTNGHLDIIERALTIFDKVIVAVISNPHKKPLFNLKDRLIMLKDPLHDAKNVSVDSFDGLLADYARAVKATAVVRGLRAVSDFDYEFQMALTNRQLMPEINTVFLMTSYKYSYLSSSLVRELASLGGDVKNLVPDIVIKKLRKLKRKA